MAAYIGMQPIEKPVGEVWKDQNQLKLKKYALELMTSPASSVSSESAFSVANYLARKERSSLSPESLRMTMLLIEEEKLKSIHLE